MALIGTVGQVLSREINREKTLAMVLDVSTSIEMEQGIGWRSRLCIIRRIEVILAEIAIHGKLQEEIVEGVTATNKLILHIPIPSWCRSQRPVSYTHLTLPTILLV